MVLQHTEPTDVVAALEKKPVATKTGDTPLTVTAPVPYSTSGALRNPFPPIADYGFLSDCETTALVAPSGAVEWMCLPRMDSPSVFGAILDRDAGTFRLGPANVSVPTARRYLPGTNVLERM